MQASGCGSGFGSSLLLQRESEIRMKSVKMRAKLLESVGCDLPQLADGPPRCTCCCSRGRSLHWLFVVLL